MFSFKKGVFSKTPFFLILPAKLLVHMIRRVALLLGFCVLSNLIVAQSDNAEALKYLKEEGVERSKERKARINRYIEKTGSSLSYYDSQGYLVLLVDVTDSGIPVYRSVDNAGAAATVGIPAVRSGGTLGLNLEGEGITVGVWDEGLVEHSEYEGRILSQQGSSAVHANHVTGTIIASGINPAVKGMAPKSRAYTFDFNNDEEEMLTLATSDQSTLLLSNHSYGLITGWRFNNGWQWFGDPSVSAAEDYRFGFYSGNAAYWDQIAFNAPFYSIIKSAGNDRSDQGSGSPAPDCNGGSGYDCISDVSTAKNIITVGAVNKINTYVDNSSVIMSSFSSWGPTDDGRIKPDLVAAGVGLNSTSTNNGYTTLSGTSMASPSVTGSLALMQELSLKLRGSYLKASTLKALAIHTVKEAGLQPGPDYRFGWGLLDVEAMAKVLLQENGSDVVITEQTLNQGQKYELTLTPLAGEKITATLVWTDPAGIPIAPSLDPVNLMLVNDLDIRISDDAGNTLYPWILDPQNPDFGASTGDNFRDNVEKIEFALPDPRNYKLVVSHKGNLSGGLQSFSLILTYKSTNESQSTYYWVGGSGDWNDGSHWSVNSGGVPIQRIPTSVDRVVVDENSFFLPNQQISLSTNVEVGSLTWFNRLNSGISLNENELTLNGGLTLAVEEFKVKSKGTLKLTGSISDQTNLISRGNDLSVVKLVFAGNSDFLFKGDIKVNTLLIESANLEWSGFKVEADSIMIGSEIQTLDISGSELKNVKFLKLDKSITSFRSSGTKILLGQTSYVTVGGNRFDGSIVSGNIDFTLAGNNNLNELTINGAGTFDGNNTISRLTLNSKSSLSLVQGTTQNLSSNTVINSDSQNRISVSGLNGVAYINFVNRVKLCFDFLEITNVDLIGAAVISAGLSSTVANSQNWSLSSCENILFPDFELSNVCEFGLLKLESTSTGDVSDVLWSIDPSDAELINSGSTTSYAIFKETGVFDVSLSVSNDTESRSFVRQITVGANDLQPNRAILNGLNLFSFLSAPTYQWYKDFEPVEGATSRSFVFGGEPGHYFVLTKNELCNRVSEAVLVTGIGTEESSIIVFPNPAKDIVNIYGVSVFSKVEIFNSMGQKVIFQTESITSEQTLIIKGLQKGVYAAKIEDGNKFYVTKIIVE